MSGFISYPYAVSVVSVVTAVGGELLAGETDAMGIDFTYHTDITKQLYISDLTTPANNYNGTAQGKLTYTSPSVKMTRQVDGVWRYVNHNLCFYSQVFATDWSATNVTATDNQTVAPDDTMTAGLVVGTAVNTFHRVLSNIIAVASGAAVRFIFYAKAQSYSRIAIREGQVTGAYVTFLLSGGGSVLDSGAGGTGSITSIGSGWYRCVMDCTSGGSVRIDLRPLYDSYTTGAPGNELHDGTSGVYIWGGQIKRTPVNDAGGFTYATGYLATTTTALYDLPYEWSAALASQGILIEEARTNLALRSDDFTNASWTKSNMTTAYTSTGPDGVANSASRLTASAANATALQAITSGSAARVSSFFVKRITGTGNIDITQDNGSTWATITVTAGWTRVECAAATLTNPTVGIRIVTNTDAVDVFRFQHEVGAFPTSPIHTIAATMTRVVDNITLATSLFGFSATAGTLYAKFQPINVAAIRFAAALDGAANNRIAIGSSAAGAGYFSVINTTEQIGPLTNGTVAAGAASKDAASWTTTGPAFALSTNGIAASTIGAGTLPTVTSLGFGTGSSAATPLNGYLQQLAHYKRAMGTTELASKTT